MTRSYLAADLVVTGTVESRGAIQVAGRVEGTLRGHTVDVTQDGSITGEVDAESLTVAGRVSGAVCADDASVARGGHVSGSLLYRRLGVARGAMVEASCKPLVSAEATATKPAAPVRARKVGLAARLGLT